MAVARAVSDSFWHAYVADVAVSDPHRRCGIGRAVMRLLLDHPAVRNVAIVRLATLDAQAFYADLGFVEATPEAGRPTLMIRDRRALRLASPATSHVFSS